MFCVHEIGILALDFANENARISQLPFEGGGLRLSACELPNLHACSAAHVQAPVLRAAHVFRSPVYRVINAASAASSNILTSMPKAFRYQVQALCTSGTPIPICWMPLISFCIKKLM
jgi:hypothetical protein